MPATDDLLIYATTRQLLKSGKARALRERHNISQEDLAVRIGVQPVTLNRWELGKHRPSARSDAFALYAEFLAELAELEVSS